MSPAASLRSAALLAAILLAAACAGPFGRAPQQLLPEDARTADQGREVMVMLPLADRATLDATTAALVATQPLMLIALWPMDQIELYCLVFAVEADHDVDAVLTELAADDRVVIAQPVQLFETAAALTDDPLIDLQPGLEMTGTLFAQTMATGRGVRVAVIDTGVDVAHPELASRVVVRRDLVDGRRVAVAERHGTAVAGVVAAEADNGLGITGVAPDAVLLAMRGCWQPADAAGGRCSSFTLARALNAALAADADIINLSLTGPRDPVLERFVDRALADGRSVVAAVSADVERGFPAAAPGVVAVDRIRAASHAAGVVPAPGTDILSTVPGGGFAVFAGSSLAAAHVAGVLAMMREQAPDARAEALRDTLLSSVRRSPDGRPVLDSCAAVAAAGGHVDAVLAERAAALCPTS